MPPAQDDPSSHDVQSLPTAKPLTLMDLISQFQGGNRRFYGVGINGHRTSASLPKPIQLAEIELINCNFVNVDFSGANLKRSTMKRCTFIACGFEGANLTGANLSDSKLDRCKLDKASMRGAYLRDATIDRCSIIHTDLAGVELGFGTIVGVDLSNAFVGYEGPPQGATHIDTSTLRQTHAGLRRRPENTSAVEGFLKSCGVDQEWLPWRRPNADGLTLTFESRLHRFDETVVSVLAAEVLGHESEVAVVGRSDPAREPPSWFRISGASTEELIRIAEAFYERVWAQVPRKQEELLTKAAFSSGMEMILRRLDSIRDTWSSASITPPRSQQAAPSHHLAPSEQVRLERLTSALSHENKARALARLLVRALPIGTLHQWIEEVYGRAVSAELPGPVAPHAQLAADTVALLNRHGMVNSTLFEALYRTAPSLGGEIQKVQQEWCCGGILSDFDSPVDTQDPPSSL